MTWLKINQSLAAQGDLKQKENYTAQTFPHQIILPTDSFHAPYFIKS
jgi:hypothetical protein